MTVTSTITAGSTDATTEQPAKSVYIRTFGCQMNVYDSERMLGVLARDGYRETSDLEAADLVVLNTCHIREKAAEKVYSDLGRIRDAKKARAIAGKDTLVAVTGCVAQAEGSEITARAPVVDVVAGPQSYQNLPRLLAEAQATRRRVVATEFAAADKFATLERQPAVAGAARSPVAFLTVQEGCDKFCTFCVVPYTRGAEFSRPVAAIVTEAERLVASGVKEITLLGQNVNAYHGEGPHGAAWSLGRLLRRLADMPGLVRLRYMTSHPRDMDDDLIAAHAELAALMPFLHLPFQSGSDRILKAMNRRHSADDYRRLIDRIRAAQPDIALSTDIICGFPDETDADFAATLQLIRDIEFAQAFSFNYSGRPGTPAMELKNQVSDVVKSDRLQQLQGLLFAQQTAFNRSRVGRTLSVLLEKPGRQAGQLIGRSPYLQSVHVQAGTRRIGDLVHVAITGATQNSLTGTIVSTG